MLVLFDIDGTLLLKAHVEHRHAPADAVQEVWGVEDPGPAAVPAAGRTDGEIAREICLLGGVGAERIDDATGAFRAAGPAAYAPRCAPGRLRRRAAAARPTSRTASRRTRAKRSPSSPDATARPSPSSPATSRR